MHVETSDFLILAGGLATGMRPLTNNIPKCMIEIDGKPFLEHQLNLIKGHGYRKVVLAVGYLGSLVEDYFGNGQRMGMQLKYSNDYPDLLGTGGAIKKALPLLSDPFFVMYGDSLLLTRYSDVEQSFITSKFDGLMTVYKNQNSFYKNNVGMKGDQIAKYYKGEKSADGIYDSNLDHIDWGLSLFKKRAWKTINYEKFDLGVVVQSLIKAKKLQAYAIENEFYEIGSPQGLAQVKGIIAKNEQMETVR